MLLAVSVSLKTTRKKREKKKKKIKTEQVYDLGEKILMNNILSGKSKSLGNSLTILKFCYSLFRQNIFR